MVLGSVQLDVWLQDIKFCIGSDEFDDVFEIAEDNSIFKNLRKKLKPCWRRPLNWRWAPEDTTAIQLRNLWIGQYLTNVCTTLTTLGAKRTSCSLHSLHNDPITFPIRSQLLSNAK